MNFQEVIIELKKGHKVARKGWGDNPLFEGCYIDGKDNGKKKYLFGLNDFEATDWEIVNYKEQKQEIKIPKEMSM